MAPKAIGICTTSPFLKVARSSGVRAGSLAPKSAVPAASCAMPAPEPTGWGFTVMPWSLRALPHGWEIGAASVGPAPLIVPDAPPELEPPVVLALPLEELS